MFQRDDRSLLAQFFFADDALNMIAAELDSFDGRKDPERCSTLVNQLRHAQVCESFYPKIFFVYQKNKTRRFLIAIRSALKVKFWTKNR